MSVDAPDGVEILVFVRQETPEELVLPGVSFWQKKSSILPPFGYLTVDTMLNKCNNARTLLNLRRNKMPTDPQVLRELYNDPDFRERRNAAVKQHNATYWTEERKREVSERMKRYHASKESKKYRESLEKRDHGGWRRKNGKDNTES